MIDLHSHIVPGVDDGAQTEEEALQMLQIAAEDGVETIVATPHLFSTHNLIKDPDTVLEKTAEFVARAARQRDNAKAPDIRVVGGAEVFLTANIVGNLTRFGERLTLNGGSYFLLEFPFEFIFPGTREAIFSILTAGFIPVIVHPERNKVIQRRPAILYDLVKVGAFAQVNAGSLGGFFGRDARDSALCLLRHHLAHVIASDAHTPAFRSPQLAYAGELLKKEGIETGELLLGEAPRAILENRDVPEGGEPRNPERKRSFFDFLKGKNR